MTKLPQKFLGNVVPLTGSDKVLCLFDPTIDKTSDKPLGLYGTTGEKVIGTVRGILGK